MYSVLETIVYYFLSSDSESIPFYSILVKVEPGIEILQNFILFCLKAQIL